MRVKQLFATALLLPLIACGEEGPEPVPQQAEEETTAAPAPAPEPEPLMRRPIHCCSDLVLEDALKAYLVMGDVLAKGTTEGMEEPRATFAAKLEELGAEHDLAPLAEVIAGMEACELEACRDGFGTISDTIVSRVTGTHSGDLDIAVAYSRKHQHHWIQQGNELASPYGDGIESFSWGTREEVETADSGREAEHRASAPMAPPEEDLAPPVEAEPPPGSNIAPPPEQAPQEHAATAEGEQDAG